MAPLTGNYGIHYKLHVVKESCPVCGKVNDEYKTYEVIDSAAIEVYRNRAYRDSVAYNSVVCYAGEVPFIVSEVFTVKEYYGDEHLHYSLLSGKFKLDGEWIDEYQICAVDHDCTDEVIKGTVLYAPLTLYVEEEIIEGTPCKGICTALYNGYIQASSQKPYDLTFEKIFWAHGASAFRRVKSVEELIQRLEWLIDSTAAQNKPEICCAHKTERIGAAGIFVRGEVVCASNIDLWSEADYSSGERYIPQHMISATVKNFNDFAVGIHSHCEVILKPREVFGIWVKDWYLNDNPDAEEKLRALCNKYGVRFM